MRLRNASSRPVIVTVKGTTLEPNKEIVLYNDFKHSRSVRQQLRHFREVTY